jgi:transposase
MSTTRRRFSKAFKLKVVHAYISGTPVAEVIRQFDIHQNLVYKWTQEYQASPETAFRGSADEDTPQSSEQRIAELERVLGRVTLENEFLKKALSHAKNILGSDKPGNTKS